MGKRLAGVVFFSGPELGHGQMEHGAEELVRVREDPTPSIFWNYDALP